MKLDMKLDQLSSTIHLNVFYLTFYVNENTGRDSDGRTGIPKQ